VELSMIARGKAEKKVARTARLSAALRENLKRRKAQARGRAKSDDSEEIASPQEGAEADTPDFRRNRGSD
jgi:hypothetical protein